MLGAVYIRDSDVSSYSHPRSVNVGMIFLIDEMFIRCSRHFVPRSCLFSLFFSFSVPRFLVRYFFDKQKFAIVPSLTHEF